MAIGKESWEFSTTVAARNLKGAETSPVRNWSDTVQYTPCIRAVHPAAGRSILWPDVIGPVKMEPCNEQRIVDIADLRCKQAASGTASFSE